MKKGVIVLLLAVSLMATACRFSVADNIEADSATITAEPVEGTETQEIFNTSGENPWTDNAPWDGSTKIVTYEVYEYNRAVNEVEIPSNIFDDNINTKWCSSVENPSTYVIWKASSPIAVKGYAITTANDNSKYPGRNPISWTFYGCNSDTAPDANSNWIVIDQRTCDRTLLDTDFEACYFETQTYVPECQYFMLEITETAGADVFQISEFKISYSGGAGLFDYTLKVEKDGSGAAYDKLEADMKMVFDSVYEKIVEEYNPNAPKTVIVQIKEHIDSEIFIAYTLGNVVTVSLDYYDEHPEDYDSFTHELGHVVQLYTMSVPSWLTEGIADYIRYQYGINNVNSGWMLPSEVGDDQKYTDSYKVTAAFLKWIEENVYEGFVKEISSLITKGEYKESDWERITGASVDELWEIYTDPERRL